MSLWPAPSTHSGSTALGQRSKRARPWEKSITSSSVPWMISTGDGILDTFSMLEETEKVRQRRRCLTAAPHAGSEGPTWGRRRSSTSSWCPGRPLSCRRLEESGEPRRRTQTATPGPLWAPCQCSARTGWCSPGWCRICKQDMWAMRVPRCFAFVTSSDGHRQHWHCLKQKQEWLLSF